jgi:hypothetical protein
MRDGFRRQHLMLVALGVGVMIAAYVVHGFWRRELSHLT